MSKVDYNSLKRIRDAVESFFDAEKEMNRVLKNYNIESFDEIDEEDVDTIIGDLEDALYEESVKHRP